MSLLFSAPLNPCKESTAAADELDRDALEKGCQQHQAKHVFWTLSVDSGFMRLLH